MSKSGWVGGEVVKRLGFSGEHMPYRKRQRFLPEMAAEESDLFDSLPDDLVISILSRLSSSAGCPSDFVNVLMTHVADSLCKRLNSLALRPLVLSKGSPKMFAIKAKNWSESARRFWKLCADAGNAEACYALLLLSEFISLQKWQELFVKFCEDEKIAEKFQAFCLKVKEEQRRKFREELEKLFEVLEEDEANQYSDDEPQNK